MIATTVRLAAVLAVIELLAACGKSNKEIEDESASFEPKMRAQWAAQVIAPERRGPAFDVELKVAATPTGPGPAYLYVSDVGLVTIDAGEATLERFPLGRVTKIVVTPDGSIVVVADYVYRIEKGAPTKLGGESAPPAGFLSDTAVGPDGTIWLATDRAVHAWSGTAWTSHPDVVPDDSSINKLMVEGEGRVLVAAQKSVVVFDGAWKVIYDASGVEKTPFNDPPVARTVLLTASGELVWTDHRSIFRRAGKDIVRNEVSGGLGFDVFLRGDDLIGIGGGDEPVSFGLDGSARPAPYGAVKTSSVNTIDQAGRLWTKTSDGFAVYSNASDVVSWPAGSLAAISGEVTAVAVVGSGPAELPSAGTIASGVVTGLIARTGKPIAKARVELCQSAATSYEKGADSACLDASPVRTETDAEGRFSVEAALRSYQVLVRDGGDWFKLLGGQCAGMSAGDTCDLGTLELSNTL